MSDNTMNDMTITEEVVAPVQDGAVTPPVNEQSGMFSLPMGDDYLEEFIQCIDPDNILDVEFDAEAFQRGVNAMSEMCGKITALVNVGLTPTMALSYIAGSEESKQVAAHNLEVSKVSAEASVEAAKYGASFAQKMSI